MWDPKTQVKVISNSTTFYPPDTRNEEGLTLINSIAFLQENFGENIHSFTSEDTITVLQMWNGLLFSISAKETISEGLLRFLLQTIKDAATFLFGAKFETYMSKNIYQAHKEIYAKYVEKFFQLCNEDYKNLLNLPVFDQSYTKINQAIRDTLKPDPYIQSETFLEGFLFKDHKIVTRFSKNDTKIIDVNDIYILSLFEQIEFPAINLEEPASSSIQLSHKSSNPHIDGVPQQCLISSGRLGARSPFVLLLFSHIQSQPTAEQKDAITAVATKIAALINGSPSPPPRDLHFQITGLLHYVLINRNTGECFEPHPPQPSSDPEDQKWCVLFDGIKQKLASIGMDALTNGQSSVIRNEMIFQYTYDIVFVNSKKSKEFAPKQFGASSFADNGGISYKKIIRAAGDDNTVCYELMTAYLGVMNTADVVKANAHLFKVLTDVKRKMD